MSHICCYLKANPARPAKLFTAAYKTQLLLFISEYVSWHRKGRRIIQKRPASFIWSCFYITTSRTSIFLLLVSSEVEIAEASDNLLGLLS